MLRVREPRAGLGSGGILVIVVDGGFQIHGPVLAVLRYPDPCRQAHDDDQGEQQQRQENGEGQTGLPSKLKATPPMAKADKLRAPATRA